MCFILFFLLFLQDQNAVDVIVMTIIRCLAILFSYYHFRNLQKLGSKYILGEFEYKIKNKIQIVTMNDEMVPLIKPDLVYAR